MSHLDRVRTELFELQEKIDALTVFTTVTPLFKKLESKQQRLLKEQLVYMQEYARVLRERLQ